MLFVLIPVFNEVGNIGGVVEGIARAMSGMGQYRLLVVDDGSVDGTTYVVRALVRRYPIDIVEFCSNRGIGEVLNVGLRKIASQAEPDDVIVFLEGDGSNDLDLLPQMLECVHKGSDIVIASRFREGGIMKGFPLLRRVLSLSLSGLFRLVLPHGVVSDPSIFYRAYRAGLIKRGLEVFGDRLIHDSGFSANTELLLNLLQLDPIVQELPLRYEYHLKKSRSRIRIGREVSGHLLLLAKTLKNRRLYRIS